MALFIEIKAADGLVARTRLEPGTNRFTVRLGDNYRIIDDQTGLTPQGVAVKRVDNNLVVDRLGTSGTSVEFADFYNICSAGSPCDLSVVSSAGSAPVAITPATQPIGALADGSFVLYDPTYAETAPPAPSFGDGATVRNVLYGLGGLAVVGVAAGGGGGGGSDGGNAPASGALRLTSPQVANTRTPTLSGEGEPGSRVIVRIDTSGDGVTDVVYNTAVGSDARWSINLASAVPESGALPAGGLPDASAISITSTTAAGNVSLPVFPFAFDGTPPGAPVINAIGGDDQISLSERADGVVVSGVAESSAAVLVTLGTRTQAATAGAQGGWQVSFDAAAVGSDGPIRVDAVATDQAGNTGAATSRTATVNTLPGINPVTGDNQISLSEWASGVTVTGTNPAGTRAGVQMTVTVGGVSRVVQTDAAGNWSAAYSAAELPTGGAAAISAVAGVSGITSATATASANVSTAPTITSIAGDNVINLAERSGDIVVAGSTPAGTGAGVALTVGLGSAARAVQTDANGNWSAVFSGSETPISGSINASAVATAVGATGQQTVASARVDTAPTLSGPIATDGIINQGELAGTTPAFISGSAPAGAPDGSQVIVTLSGLAPVAAQVAGGSWSLPVSSLGIPAANATYQVSAVGNVGGATGEAATGSVRVDVTASGITGIFVTADNRISQAELDARPGFVVVGTSEAGSIVNVTLGGVSKPTVIAEIGTWTTGPFNRTDFPALLLDPDGPLALAVTVTNAEGNVSRLDQPIAVIPPDPILTPTVPILPAPLAPPSAAGLQLRSVVVQQVEPETVPALTAETIGLEELLSTTSGPAPEASSSSAALTPGVSSLLQALEQQGLHSPA